MNRTLLDAVGGEFSSASVIDRPDSNVARASSSNSLMLSGHLDHSDSPTTIAQVPATATVSTLNDAEVCASAIESNCVIVESLSSPVVSEVSTAPIKTSPPVSGLSSNESIPTIKIGPQHFDLLKLVGEGAFGKVILVRNRLNKQLYAMKAISKKLLRKKNNMQYMKSERDILTKVHHPFIVTLWFAFQTEQRLFLVMDFLAGGELFFHLKRRGLILEPEARLYLAEMILAIDFLHTMGVVHRDLKPENVLLRPDGHICLTDFGLAKEVGDNSQVRTLCGTSEYMAPEMLLRNGYTKAVDWWSLGALFFEILAGRPPFQAKTPKELDRKILSEKASIPPYVTANAAALIKGLLEKDVNKRLGAVKSTMFSIGGVAALKAHAFFEDLDWHAVLACRYEPPIRPMAAASLTQAMPATSPFSSSASSTISVAVPGVTGVVQGPESQTSLLLATAALNFHEGFTGQCLSPSVIEESLGGGGGTPLASPAPSRDPTPSLSRSNSFNASMSFSRDTDDSSAYEGFEFVDPGFSRSITADQLLEFDAELAGKQQRSAKKMAHKQRLLDEKSKKAAEETDKAQDEQRRIKAMRDLEVRRHAAVEARDRAREKRRDEILRLEAALRARDDWEASCDRAAKKLRNAAKKLKEVVELEAKIAGQAEGQPPLTQEQRLKLRRKADLEAEVTSAEGELNEVRSLEPKASTEEGSLDPEDVLRRLAELKSLPEIELELEPGPNEPAVMLEPEDAARCNTFAVPVPQLDPTRTSVAAFTPTFVSSSLSAPAPALPLIPAASLVTASAPTVPVPVLVPAPAPAPASTALAVPAPASSSNPTSKAGSAQMSSKSIEPVLTLRPTSPKQTAASVPPSASVPPAAPPPAPASNLRVTAGEFVPRWLQPQSQRPVLETNEQLQPKLAWAQPQPKPKPQAETQMSQSEHKSQSQTQTPAPAATTSAPVPASSFAPKNDSAPCALANVAGLVASPAPATTAKPSWATIAAAKK